MSGFTQPFDIRNFLEQLEATKEKNKYICPLCSGNNLGIQPETGKYQCFSGCECKDIREALKPWTEVLDEQKKNQTHSKKMVKGQTVVKPKVVPASLPEGDLVIVRLSETPKDLPQPQAPQFLSKAVRETLAKKGCTPEEISKATVTVYEYGDSKKVFRYDCPCKKNDKGREKTFAVCRTDEDGQVRWNKGTYTWAAYRQDEATASALATGDEKIPVILSVEGEKCLEALRAERLSGISPQGTASEEDWVCILNEMKTRIGDREFILAHLEDNDPTGEKKAQTIAKAANRCQVPFVAIDLTVFVPELCDKGDVADILADGMTGDELEKCILLEIQRRKTEQISEDEYDEDDGDGEDRESAITLDPTNPESRYKAACKKMGLPFEDCVTATAFDTWVYHRQFSGAENWRVIDSAFFKWSEVEKFWQYQTDNRVLTLIADAGEKAFKLSGNPKNGYEITKPYGTNNHTESAFKYVRKRLERPEPLPTNTHLLGLRNCVVDLRTGQQMPHSKEYFLTNIIPYDYEPSKPCPEVFQHFITESFGAEMLEVIRAFTSMFLDPTAPYGRFPHLIGQSGGGKGTLGRFWSSLFGEEGSGSAAMFSDLATPEGRHQYLTGKRIFGFPDVGGYAQGVRAFYEMVDNGPMTGRALFNPVAYNKQWYMRFWLASVDHLQIENAGDGWIRRAYPIPVKSRSVKPDPDLRMKLEAAKADIVSWALAMPREERNHILLSPPESEKAINLALDAALYGDSTKSFVDLCLRPSQDSGFVHHYQIHDWYVAYCRTHGYTPLGMSKFISHLKTVLPRNFRDRSWTRTINGKRERLPAHWEYLAPLPNIFTSSENNSDQNLLWTCIKSRCEEGGLMDFEDFWQPKTPEPISGAAVHPVQGTLERENYLGQAESLTQSGCPPCPFVHTGVLGKKNLEELVSSESLTSPMSEKASPEDGTERTGWTAAPDIGSSLSTPPVEALDQGGQGGQSLQNSDSCHNALENEKMKSEEQQWLTRESLEEIANNLERCENCNMLAELRELYPAYAMKEAAKLLPDSTKRRIQQWVVAQNGN